MQSAIQMLWMTQRLIEGGDIAWDYLNYSPSYVSGKLVSPDASQDNKWAHYEWTSRTRFILLR